MAIKDATTVAWDTGVSVVPMGPLRENQEILWVPVSILHIPPITYIPIYPLSRGPDRRLRILVNFSKLGD